MEHRNVQVDTALLPDIETLNYTGLKRGYLKLLLFYNTLFNLVLVLIIVIYAIFRFFEMPDPLFFIIMGLFAIRIIWSYISINFGFRYKAYALREKDIVYKSGWLWRSTVTAPFNRVQHLRIDQGPLERKFELAKLKIFTAGGNSSDITIPGLHPSEARKLKQFIVDKSAIDEEE